MIINKILFNYHILESLKALIEYLNHFNIYLNFCHAFYHEDSLEIHYLFYKN